MRHFHEFRQFVQ